MVSLDTTFYCHCVSRCVLRAFLCGVDARTGQNFEHRRQWIEDCLSKLGNMLAIDIAAYEAMSKHCEEGTNKESAASRMGINGGPGRTRTFFSLKSLWLF